MNNSETQFSIKAVKVEEVICVFEENYQSALGANQTVRHSREFWLLSNGSLNISAKLY